MEMYETTFIIDGTISDDEREKTIKRFEKSLTDKGAEITRTVRWGKRQLAYEIKKRIRGYYVIFYFNADPSIVNPFHREMDLSETILRYMTLRSDGAHPDYIRDEGEPSGTTESSASSSTPASKPEASESKDSADSAETESTDDSSESKDSADSSETESTDDSAETEDTDDSEDEGEAAEEDTSSEDGKETGTTGEAGEDDGETDKGGE